MQMEKVWGTFFNARVNSDKTTDKLVGKVIWHAIILGGKTFNKDRNR